MGSVMFKKRLESRVPSRLLSKTALWRSQEGVGLPVDGATAEYGRFNMVRVTLPSGTAVTIQSPYEEMTEAWREGKMLDMLMGDIIDHGTAAAETWEDAVEFLGLGEKLTFDSSGNLKAVFDDGGALIGNTISSALHPVHRWVAQALQAGWDMSQVVDAYAALMARNGVAVFLDRRAREALRPDSNQGVAAGAIAVGDMVGFYMIMPEFDFPDSRIVTVFEPDFTWGRAVRRLLRAEGASAELAGWVKKWRSAQEWDELLFEHKTTT